ATMTNPLRVGDSHGDDGQARDVGQVRDWQLAQKPGESPLDLAKPLTAAGVRLRRPQVQQAGGTPVRGNAEAGTGATLPGRTLPLPQRLPLLSAAPSSRRRAAVPEAAAADEDAPR